MNNVSSVPRRATALRNAISMATVSSRALRAMLPW